ncbi:MAG: type II toxin-antitoxin system PemK/MazF family toxin [Gammaproteobacteria bacterium]|nr:type II toxin-antitoxin system PemK/MazF family toxin [Gammaproteobacteria bacterium]
MMKRGDIYLVNLEPTIGSEIKKIRPCVIVSATPINKARRTVVVVPLSSVTKNVNPPIVVPVNSLGINAVAVCDQIRTVDKSRLLTPNSIQTPHTFPAGALSPADLHMLDDALRQVLSL